LGNFKLIDFLYWYSCPVIGFISLTGLLLFFLIKKRFPSIKSLKIITILLIIFLLLAGIFFTIINSYLWSKQWFGQFFLTKEFIIGYSYYHYFSKNVLNIFWALFWLAGIHYFNKNFQNRFFYEEEKWLAAISILSNGWPNSVLYLALVFLLALLSHFGLKFYYRFKKRPLPADFRLSFLYFWLPVALFVNLFGVIIIKSTFFKDLMVLKDVFA